MKLSKSFIFHIKRMKPRKNSIYSYTQQMLLIFLNDWHFIKGGIEFPHILQLLIRNGYNAILNKIIVKASMVHNIRLDHSDGIKWVQRSVENNTESVRHHLWDMNHILFGWKIVKNNNAALQQPAGGLKIGNIHIPIWLLRKPKLYPRIILVYTIFFSRYGYCGDKGRLY